jgi:succinyl-diaminopimelate desuccinylase
MLNLLMVFLMKGIDYEIFLLRDLVEIDTDVMKKVGYSDCASLIREKMKELGLKVEVFDPNLADGIKRPSVVGTLDVGSDTTIGLVTHYDVVPPGEGWTKPPFRLTLDDGKAYGRGAADDKSAIAASLGAVNIVRDNARFNVKVLASPEEEVGGEWGIGYLMQSIGLKFDFGIIVDSMPNIVSIGASGIVQGEIKVVGKQGHAGYPHRAINPVHELSKLINEFEKFIKLREGKLSSADAPPGSPKEKVWGRLSFTMLGGGIKENVIPSEAWTRFDMRLLPEEDPEVAKKEMLEFFESVRNVIKGFATISFRGTDRGYLTSPTNRFVKSFVESTKIVFGSPLPLAASLGGDDGRFLANRGIPVVSYGTIAEDTNFHGVDEYVHLKDLKNVRDVFVNFIKRD